MATLYYENDHVTPPSVVWKIHNDSTSSMSGGMSHPVTGQTLDQAEDGAIEDVRDYAAVVRLFLPLGTKQQLS